MKLTQEEMEMVQALRIANGVANKADESNYRQSRGNLNSMLGVMLSEASRSYNEEVKTKAMELQKDINSIGGIEALNDNQIQVLLNAGKEAVALDNNLSSSFEMVVSTAHTYNNGITDEEILEQTRKEFDAKRNSFNEDEIITFENPQTGKVYVQNRDGSIQEYNADAMYQQAQQESEAAFMEHLQSGGSAESFGILNDDSLVEK
ncbi:MAG: hypothetical protein JXQ67_05185 [Campylobacterales bacterium]|nr:hypothetical protein [Campylobacterales bacterium]